MGQLYRLDRKLSVDIPTPYNSDPADTYAVLDLEVGDPVLTTGGTAIIKDRLLVSGYLHAIQTSIGAIIARLTLLPDDLVKVDSFCQNFPSHTTHLDKLTVIGAICELYPKGLDGARWILWEPSMGAHNQTHIAKPALKASKATS